MPNGALLELVSRGVQDIYIYGNPQITYFKVVYKRHTNFAMESVRGDFDGVMNFGNKVTATIPISGDLVYGVMLEVDLPELTSVPTIPTGGLLAQYSGAKGNISWINNIGHGLIDKIEVYIGGQLIDTQYGEWMEIWTQLSQEEGRKRGLDYMLSRSTLSGSDGPAPVVVTGPKTVYIPLQFWFCRNIGLALPLIALQYHEVYFDIYLRPLERLYTFGANNYYNATYVSPTQLSLVKQNVNSANDIDTNDAGKIIVLPSGQNVWIDPNAVSIPISGAGTVASPYIIQVVTNTAMDPTISNAEVYIKPNGALSGQPSITEARIFYEFIYLDNYERREFSKINHRYLIEQVQASGNQSVEQNLTTFKFNLTFNLPVKELFWVFQLQKVVRDNDIFNFSNTTDPTQVRGNTLISSVIQYNGIDRFTERKADYFRLIQPYYYHTRVPNDFFYVYSFGLKPEEHQPSGEANFSKISSVDMFFTIPKQTNQLEFRVYATNYNILRINNGMGGLAFND